MKQCCEYIIGLRYKLIMMDILCEAPAYIHGDNRSVLANTSMPESTLKKKSQSIAYHFIREGAARDKWRTAYINTHKNNADLLTKCLPSREKRKEFVQRLLHHIFHLGWRQLNLVLLIFATKMVGLDAPFEVDYVFLNHSAHQISRGSDIMN